jgi:threonine dehydratase
MRELGAEIHLIPGGYAQAENAGITYAREMSATWVSPYNDGLIIAGQGTIALEALKQLQVPDPITWVVPAGGGGLLSGIGCALARLSPGAKLVGAQSEASAFLHQIYHHGTQEGVVELPSLADGLSGPVENGSVTVPLVKQYAADFILVSESEIRQAIRYAWDVYHECIEGSAAVALAAVLSGKVPTRPALLVLTGGNINPTDLEQILG